VINAGIIGPLLQLLQTAEFDIKKEAAWAVSNATSGGSHEQIKYVYVFSTYILLLFKPVGNET
jgi:importin subunit alpha-6/7